MKYISRLSGAAWLILAGGLLFAAGIVIPFASSGYWAVVTALGLATVAAATGAAILMQQTSSAVARVRTEVNASRSKLNDIAGSVGRTAPLIREISTQSRLKELGEAAEALRRSREELTHQRSLPPAGSAPLDVAPQGADPLPELPRNLGQWASQLRRADFHVTDKQNWLLEHELILHGAAGLENRDYFRAPESREPRAMRVGLIADEFTHNSFSPEFEAVTINPSDGVAAVESGKLDLLLVESAWRGMPTAAAPWKGRVYASARFGYENRTALLDILRRARANGVPSVFWNKEDPTHFGDRVNDFVSTASRCDYVMTTAEECIQGYEAILGEGRAACMPFAVQPRIFNPLGIPLARERGVVFAGSWYRVHPGRAAIMDEIFREIMGNHVPLKIYDRYFGVDSPNFEFPDEYKSMTHASVPHDKTADLYRHYEFGLNINTVTDSQTMFARRAFELAACASQVVSNESPGMRRIFGDNVLWAGTNDGPVMLDLSSEMIRRNQISLLNTVLADHTYEARFESILDLLKIKYTSFRKATTLVAFVASEADADRAVAIFRQMPRVAKHLVLIVDRSVETHLVATYYRRYVSSGVRVVSARYWMERGVPTKTVLDTPTAFILDRVEDVTQEQVLRALSHKSYATTPVSPAVAPQLPRLQVTAPGTFNTLIDASELHTFIDGRFDVAPTLVV